MSIDLTTSTNGTIDKTAHINHLTVFGKSLQQDHDAIRHYIPDDNKETSSASHTTLTWRNVSSVVFQLKLLNRLELLLVPLPHGQWTGEAPG